MEGPLFVPVGPPALVAHLFTQASVIPKRASRRAMVAVPCGPTAVESSVLPGLCVRA